MIVLRNCSFKRHDDALCKAVPADGSPTVDVLEQTSFASSCDVEGGGVELEKVLVCSGGV